METLPIESFSVSGYRSFGATPQRFESLTKINLLIGQNNCGKSNVLRFLTQVYPLISISQTIPLSELDRHSLGPAKFSAGVGLPMVVGPDGNYDDFLNTVVSKFRPDRRSTEVTGYIKNTLERKSNSDLSQSAWFDYDENAQLIKADWIDAFAPLLDHQVKGMWRALHPGRDGGARDADWIPETLQKICVKPKKVNAVLIPAIRKVGEKGTTSDEFSGLGIIERLVRLQNPDVHSQKDRVKFDQINGFLRNVTDNSSATIEIPHERDTILVHMDGKTLPLDSLGTGIHEVIILAAASTILEESVICMEEPELHLNPLLQKKLVRYLKQSTNNQYFVTTHSAALMDTPEATIFHIRLDEGESKVVNVSSDSQHSDACRDLGYYPSDLLQANCVIWVEGPSDRAYLNFWIKSRNASLIEGVHYSIMFYGGRLASHLSGDDLGVTPTELMSLRRLNQRSAILIDSDLKSAQSKLNETKARLINEFEKGPGIAWVTEGREIENYFSAKTLILAIKEVHPSATAQTKMGKYVNNLKIKTQKGNETQASKMNVARYIVQNTTPDLAVLDLEERLTELVDFIESSNE